MKAPKHRVSNVASTTELTYLLRTKMTKTGVTSANMFAKTDNITISIKANGLASKILSISAIILLVKDPSPLIHHKLYSS
jgi:hypothetical protein